MNLRQKCKKLKQENERLRQITAVSTPISYTLNGSSVVTLGNKKMIPDSESREPLYGYIEKSIAHEMVDTIYPYIKFKCYLDEFSGNMVIESSLKVVKDD